MKNKSNPPTFPERFWAARELSSHGDKDAARVSFTKMLDDAKQRGANDEALLCTAALSEIDGRPEEALKALGEITNQDPLYSTGIVCFLRGSIQHGLANYDEAIRCYQRALDTPNYDNPGVAWSNMGIACGEKGDYDEAIRCCQKALDTPSYGTPGRAWHTMGIAYRWKSNYDEAIRCYQKALDTPSYDTPGDAWHNMGIAYRWKSDYDEAIRCYKKALETPNYDTPGRAWNNMGIACGEKGDYDEAIRCFKKALDAPNYGTPGVAWSNMGASYERLGNVEEAIRCLTFAVEQYERANDPRASYARKRIEALSVTPAERSGSDAAFLLESVPTSSGDSNDLSSADKMWAKIAETEQTAYQKYAEQSGDGQDHVLAILKGWGSAVPIIQSAGTGSRGGGYFLKWMGKGLVIDPGFDFLRNFHESGFHGRDIDAVAITHNHTDHNQDLGPIEDLFYEMGKGVDPSRRDTWRYTMIVDEDTFTANSHRLDQQMSYRNTPLRFDLTAFQYDQHQPHHLNKVAQLPFTIDYFRAHHTKDVPKAVGITVTCLDGDGKPGFTLGYSSDTGFFEDLCTDKCLGKHLDVLVADVSQPDHAERDDPDKLKESHLGLHGLIKLIEGCSPRMTIISEFWSGLTDVRLEMARELRHYFNSDSIFPGGLGLYIDPRDLTIRCSECKRYHPFHEILIVRARDQYGPLGYVCADCRL